MKVAIYRRYGDPHVLGFEDIDKPVPKYDEMLLKVGASSINDWDWGLLRGKPFMNRLAFGLFRPKIRVLGADVAGEVEAIGQEVVKFKVGDYVFGDLSGCGFGGFSEYVCAPEKAVLRIPAGMTFEEAAAIPQAGTLALQGLYYGGQIEPGQKVLINGAGGGAGTFAIQIAKASGAEVTGVDSTIKQEVMSSCGADHVIDYTKEDFTRNGQQYDRILDFAAHHSISDYRRALSPLGIYVIAGGSSTLLLQFAALGPLISKVTNKKMGVLYHRQNKDLDSLIDLIKIGKVKPVIDKIYPLNEVPEAFRYYGEEHNCGKVVITREEKAEF